MAKKKADPNDLVEVTLFQDTDKYSEPLPVIHNGKIWRLERGIPLKVPKDIKEIIDHSEYQNNMTARMIAKKEREWEEASKKL